MKKIFTHPIFIYILSFTLVLAYAMCLKEFNQEWLWGIAFFAIPVMFPVTFIMEAISTLIEN